MTGQPEMHLGIAAEQAALGFDQRHLLGQAEVHFVEIGVADQRVLLGHLLTINGEALFGCRLGRHEIVKGVKKVKALKRWNGRVGTW